MGIWGSSTISKYDFKKKTIIVILAVSAILVGGNLFEQSFEHGPPNPDILYGSDGGRHLITIDTATGAGSVISPMSPVPAGRGFVALTFDPVSPELLWAGQGSGNSAIYNVDTATGTTTLVGSTGLGATAVNALDAGPNCQLYAVLDKTSSNANNKLVTINRLNGAATPVGPGNLGMTGFDAISFKSDGKLFGVSNVIGKKGTITKLHEINPLTGTIISGSTKDVKTFGSTKSPSGGILAIEFGQDDTLYGGTGKAASGSVSDGGFLGTINLSTGIFTPRAIAATTGSSLEGFAPFVADNFPPTITLNGPPTIFMQKNKQYVDPGATSNDCHDGQQNVLGDLSGLNTGEVGQYSVPYVAVDSTGKQSLPTSRTVNVIDFIFYEPYEINPPENFDPEGTVVKSTFEIQDASNSGSITARIYTTSDQTGFTITLIQDGSSNRFVNSNVILTEADSVPSLLQLKAVSGDRIFLEYEGVTSDPPAVAGSSPTGFGSPPPSTDRIRFDSDAFPPEASTNIFVTLDPPPLTFPDSVTVNLRDDDGTGTDLSLTTLTRIGTTNTYQTVLPVILSTQSGTNSPGSSTVNPILRVETGDTIFATSPSVSSFEASAVILSPPPAVAFETPVVAVNYGTNTNCSTLGLSDPDNDGICSGTGGWETGSTALKVFLTTAEKSNSATWYKYETTESGAPANKCPRLLNIPSSPVVDNTNNPFTCLSPSKKDIFVEVDYMVNHRPDVNALLDVIKAFKNRNINLHILVDEQYASSGIPLHQDTTSWASFQVLSTQFFGTSSERALADAADKLTKKRQLFHYNGWIHTTSENPQSSGRSEIGGNEFVVSMGNFDRRVGTQDQQSSTFMHELMHNLNVRHGGNDDFNCKPNYASVINYAHQFPLESGGILSKALGQWKLDMSGVALSSVDENTLSETTNSMTGSDSLRSPIITVIGVGGIPYVVTTGGQTNWNQVGGITSGTYAQNVRHVGISGCNPTDPDQSVAGDSTLVLQGYNDLTLIKPNFRVFGSFADGLSTVPHVDGDTFVPVDPSVLAAATSNSFVALPSSTFEINEGDDITAIPLARVIDYDSDNVDVDVDWGDGSPSEMLSDVTSGGTDEDVDLSGTHAYGDNGSYDIGLTVTNDRDGLVEEMIGITVNNVAPSIGTVSVLPSTTVSPGESVTVSAEFTDPGFLDTHEGSTIDWGDGTVSGVGTGLSLVEPSSPGSVSASHAYSSSGTFTVTITVLDDDGGSASTTVEITVESVILGNFISPIDNSQYNSKRTLPVKIPVTTSDGEVVSTAILTVWVNGNPGTSKSQSGNIMTFNPAGGFYDYGLEITDYSGPTIIEVRLPGATPDSRAVTIIVS